MRLRAWPRNQDRSRIVCGTSSNDDLDKNCVELGWPRVPNGNWDSQKRGRGVVNTVRIPVCFLLHELREEAGKKEGEIAFGPPEVDAECVT
jgi:hypothetical protein